MGDDEDQKTIERDKLLLDLMIHAYDEDVARNELVDTKNSQMIVLVGVMLTLQATLFTDLLVNQLLNNEICFCAKLILSGIILLSFIFYGLSLYYYIEAYAFSKKFNSSPTPKILRGYADKDCPKFWVQRELLLTIGKVIDDNYIVIDDKVETGRKGFKWLKIACFTTFIFIFLFLIFVLF